VRLRSDVERKRLAGLAALADSRATTRWRPLHRQATTDATYARLAARRGSCWQPAGR
jgi:predicted kinase